ncbi:DUF3131 domain-containing protein [Paracoccus sp. YIM 132242]|uniref:DUF3131 domain-containing protein n=1 Tax=Paracoccus lichenicola TaxID=2665644 RepID=A0A6L6HUX8_9RHOB|nr:DUF3131 domain-containing protein [Paracoccus lichenicola]MTE01088.1 DUF3131 domain-containing protein [Paracoccus lichenicola]
MSLPINLTRARSHIIFIAALLLGVTLIFYLERAGHMPDRQPDALAAFDEVVPLPLADGLGRAQQSDDHARIAWTYFRNNTDPDTGLAGSVDKYPSTTMWETASYIVAIVSAQRLGIITDAEAEGRAAKVVDALSRLVLFEDSLPNKAYDIRTLQMVDYANRPTSVGLGWSALDIGRLMTALKMVQLHYPDLADEVEDLVAGWDLDRVTREGRLNGATVVDGSVRENQEGRIGYERYAAKGMMLWGADATAAMEVAPTLQVVRVEGVPIPVDTRLNRNSTPALTTSEPYVMDGLEFGFDALTHVFATVVYRAQEMRYRNTGTLTGVSEGHLSQDPYFAYATVWGGGSPWAVLTFGGDRIDSRRTLSTKAAFGWDALFSTEYTQEMVAAVVPFADPARGWPEGLYEADGTVNGSFTANTNAIVLAAQAFRATGPLMHVPR